jgi:hypothetical protein
MTGMRLHFEIQPDWSIFNHFSFASTSLLVMDDFTRYPFIALDLFWFLDFNSIHFSLKVGGVVRFCIVYTYICGQGPVVSYDIKIG